MKDQVSPLSSLGLGSIALNCDKLKIANIENSCYTFVYGSRTRVLEMWDKMQQQFIDWGISIKIHGITYLHFTVKPRGRYQMKIINTICQSCTLVFRKKQFLRASLVRFAFTQRCTCKHNLSYHWNLRRFSFFGPNLRILLCKIRTRAGHGTSPHVVLLWNPNYEMDVFEFPKFLLWELWRWPVSLAPKTNQYGGSRDFLSLYLQAYHELSTKTISIALKIYLFTLVLYRTFCRDQKFWFWTSKMI